MGSPAIRHIESPLINRSLFAARWRDVFVRCALSVEAAFSAAHVLTADYAGRQMNQGKHDNKEFHFGPESGEFPRQQRLSALLACMRALSPSRRLSFYDFGGLETAAP
jgi:hypothetical protein